MAQSTTGTPQSPSPPAGVPASPVASPPAASTSATQITPDQALATISAVVSQDTFIVTGLAIFLAVVGAIGATAIVGFARGTAAKLTDRYLRSQAGVDFVRNAIREEVRKQLEEKVVVMVRPDDPTKEKSEFPQSPKGPDERNSG